MLPPLIVPPGVRGTPALAARLLGLRGDYPDVSAPDAFAGPYTLMADMRNGGEFCGAHVFCNACERVVGKHDAGEFRGEEWAHECR